MKFNKRWMIAVGCGVGLAALLGAGVFLESSTIQELNAERAKLEVRIADGRRQLEKIPDLEREVIIQRETDETIRQILPSDEDINNFVRTLQVFADASGVQIESVKVKNDKSDDKADFRRVGYGLSFSADAFQLLAFLDQVESHPRFMSVSSFKLTANRNDPGAQDDGGSLRHSVALDVETYVYAPKSGGGPVKIEAYDRKKGMLANEIGKRRAGICVLSYPYGGARGRRDPWVDPRVPVRENTTPSTPIDQQIDTVEMLVDRMRALLESWNVVQKNESEIARIKALAQFERDLAPLETDIFQVRDSGQITYLSAEKRFQADVLKPIELLRAELNATTGDSGPSEDLLLETRAAMLEQLAAQKYEQALLTFATVQDQLDSVEKDQRRGPLVREIRALEATSRTVLDFENIDLQINGVVLRDGQNSVALINGRPVEVGDLLEGGLLVRAIREEEVEFVYRGVVLSREVAAGTSPANKGREKK